MIFRNTAILVFSGFISGLGMLLFASGRFFPIEPDLVNATLVFVAWQALGVIISKLGADQIVFASCMGNACSIDIRPVLLRKVLPIGLAFFVISLTKYPLLIALLMLVSILLDAASVLLQSKLNADLAVRKIFFASLLNYPVFLLLLYAVASHMEASLPIIVACFCLASLLRLVYLVGFSGAAGHDAQRMQIDGSLMLGAYQGINFWIFRGGQIAAGLSLYAGHQAVIAKLMFFWTSIELIDRFNLTVTPVVYRSLLNNDRRANLAIIAGMSLFLSALFVSFYSFSSRFLGMSLEPQYAVALGVNALLLFLPNYFVFRAVRGNQYKLLVNAGTASCVVAGALFGIMLLIADPVLALAAYIPCQLALMCAFVIALEANIMGSHAYDKDAVAESV